jgi:hypothetical protein
MYDVVPFVWKPIRHIVTPLNLLQKSVAFAQALAVSQAKACGLKSDETCVFKRLLLQN